MRKIKFIKKEIMLSAKKLSAKKHLIEKNAAIRIAERFGSFIIKTKDGTFINNKAISKLPKTRRTEINNAIKILGRKKFHEIAFKNSIEWLD